MISEGHAMPLTELPALEGTVCLIQVAPPSVVFRITAPEPPEKPAAKQVDVDGQVTSVK
jgi:hypothetical protein